MGREFIRELTPHQVVEKASLLDLPITGLPSITELSEKITLSKTLEIIGPAPEWRLTENDQTDPAGRWRIIANADVLIIQRKLAAGWPANDTSDDNWIQFMPDSMESNGYSLRITGALHIGGGEIVTSDESAAGLEIDRIFTLGATATTHYGIDLSVVMSSMTGNQTADPSLIGIRVGVTLSGAGGARTAVEARGVSIAPVGGSNMTLTDWFGVYIGDDLVGGTITNQYGIGIEDLAAAATINVGISLGTDRDIAIHHQAAANTADTELGGIIVGTSDHQGTAADSLLISNITASGDIASYVNVGGNSLEWLLVDASAQVITLGFGLTGGINLGGAAQTIPAHAVDTVNLTAVDMAAGERRLVIQTEHAAGGPIIMGTGTIWLRRFLDGATSAPWYDVGRAGGSYASPTALGSAVNIGELTFTVYNGVVDKDASWPVAAEIRAVSLQAASGTISSGKLLFLTTATGAYNSQVTRMTLEDGTANFTYPGAYVIQVDGYGAGTPGYLYLRNARGTLASPTANQSGDALGGLYWSGYGTSFAIGAAIQPSVTETWSATAHGTKMIFYTVDNTTTTLDVRMTIDQNGVVDFGLGGALANITTAGALVPTGGIAFTDVLNAWIDDATHGTGTVTHYIGNNTIDVTASSKLWKEHVVLVNGAAKQHLELFSGLLREYDYKNGSGHFVGMIAEDVRDVLPQYVVGMDTPSLKYNYMVGPLLWGWQNHEDRITRLERQLVAAGITPEE